MIGTFIYSNGRWDSAPTSDLYLAIEVPNEDYAQVDYHLTHGRLGRVFLGIQPKDYFDDDGASKDIDIPTHAQGLSTWAKTVLDRDVSVNDLKALIAPAGIDTPSENVERVILRFLALLGLPAPEPTE